MPTPQEARIRLRNITAQHRIAGEIAVSNSQRAFREQAFDGKPWDRRYPNQQPFFMNVAGAAKDFVEGRAAPLARRFQDRPAGIDKGFAGGLLGSIAWRSVNDDTIEIGSNKTYADRIHAGGEESFPWTKAAKDRFGKWYAKQSVAEKKKISKAAGHLFSVDEISTEVAARPFVGVTSRLIRELIDTLEEYYETGR